jgi:hypothetical protein
MIDNCVKKLCSVHEPLFSCDCKLFYIKRLLTLFSFFALAVGVATAGFCPREKKDGLECRSKE